jgi:hypothetical protein
MTTPLKTAAELVALLNAELRKQDACIGVSVDGITPVADERVAYTWTVPGQCSGLAADGITQPRELWRKALESMILTNR